MAKTAMLTIRLTAETNKKLATLARDTHRSRSYVASEAIEKYVDLNAWQIGHINTALAEDEENGPGVPHEEVMRWVKSWGTKRELPKPKARKIR